MTVRRTTSAACQLDDGSRYAQLHKMTTDKDYLYVTVPGHPVADSRGRVRLHRAVLFDAIGEGPHRCHWCQWDGLRWDIPDTNDPDYLTVDHVDSDKANNRLANLCASHGYCNSYRATIEQLHIPWTVFEQMPPAGRPSLRNTQTGLPTQAAHDLAKLAATSFTAPPPIESRPVRGGWTTWADDLFHPPADLAAKYPDQLRGLLP